MQRFLQKLPVVAVILLSTACSSTPRHGGWFALQMMEQPAADGPSRKAVSDDQARFEQVLSHESRSEAALFDGKLQQIREGDVIAYRKTFWDAYRDILLVRLNAVGYRLFKYGHLAIVVADPDDPSRLRLFSSESFKGPNVRETVDTLRDHDFDVYRLDKWDRVDKIRLREFMTVSMEKAGKWYGYDFMGMFGLANSNLRPTTAESIGFDYICSTVVVSALYYSGLELDAIKRDGFLDLVTPAQVVDSRGRFFPAGTEIVLVDTRD